MIIAASLLLDCPIWTEDQDFFGSGVATWTTDRIKLYLRGTEFSFLERAPCRNAIRGQQAQYGVQSRKQAGWV
jgi:hypothetical protein